MSQISFRSTYNEHQVEVVAGWDPPLQNYFLTVFDLDADEDESEVAWSAINNPDDEDYRSTDRLQAQLRSMELEAPEGFWDRVHRQERNVTHIFDDGVWVAK